MLDYSLIIVSDVPAIQEVVYFRDTLVMLCNVSGDPDVTTPRCLTSLRKLWHVGLVNVVDSASDPVTYELNVSKNLGTHNCA
jgi:hypothetical protein